MPCDQTRPQEQHCTILTWSRLTLKDELGVFEARGKPTSSRLLPRMAWAVTSTCLTWSHRDRRYRREHKPTRVPNDRAAQRVRPVSIPEQTRHLDLCDLREFFGRLEPRLFGLGVPTASPCTSEFQRCRARHASHPTCAIYVSATRLFGLTRSFPSQMSRWPTVRAAKHPSSSAFKPSIKRICSHGFAEPKGKADDGHLKSGLLDCVTRLCGVTSRLCFDVTRTVVCEIQLWFLGHPREVLVP